MTLSDRRMRVLQGLIAGQSNKQIARDLGISEQAVKDHVSGLLKYFGARNRASLVRAALSLRFTGSTTFDEAWLPSLFVEAPLHIAILSGADHLVHTANRMLRDAVGDDIVGRPAREALDPILGASVVDLVDHAYRTSARVVAHEVPVASHRGRAVVGERVRVLANPLPGRDGTVGGVFLLLCAIDDAAEGREVIATFDERSVGTAHPALLELSERTAGALRRLREVSATTGMVFDQTAIANIVASVIRALLRTDASAVFLASERTGTLRLLGDDNVSTRPRVLEIPFGIGVAGVAYASRRPIRVDDYPAWAHPIPELVGIIQSAMAVPLPGGAHPIGVIAVHTVLRRVFTDAEEWALARLAEETARLLAARRTA